MKIPLHHPHITGREIQFLLEAYIGLHSQGDGDYTRRCKEFLEEEFVGSTCLLTTSCTHALDMSAMLLDVREGDEVIVPSWTFVSTANAFATRGARIVFCDIREDTLNIDDAQIEALITPRTKAIVPVHYGGIACEMDPILELAASRSVTVVEDAAHAMFGTYKKRKLGTFGAMSTFSFHATKNFISGEGGALLINDPRYVERAEIIREKGTNRTRFYRGEVDKYTWVDFGSSYLMSDMLAAILYAQLEEYETIEALRRIAYQHLTELLTPWAVKNEIRLPIIPDHCESSHHIFYLIMPTPESRDRIIQFLKEKEIESAFHYLPLHLSPMGQRYVEPGAQFPVSEYIADRLVRIPMHTMFLYPFREYLAETIEQFTV